MQLFIGKKYRVYLLQNIFTGFFGFKRFDFGIETYWPRSNADSTGVSLSLIHIYFIEKYNDDGQKNEVLFYKK